MEKLTLRSVTQLLRATSGDRPVVAVMDDLHWADVSSIELLESLLRLCEEHPILFVNLCRPGYPTTSERIRALRPRAPRRSASREIELRPLDASAARSMLNNLFRQGDLPRDTRQRIEEKAHGNPFFIEEVVRSLVDEGAVEYVDGRFRATDKIASVTIPDSIHEVVMARVDALDVAKRQLLQTATVIGATLPRRGAGRRRRGRRASRRATSRRCCDAEFLIRSESRARTAEYAFKHPLIQEVTYESLLHARREILHRKVAETMERIFPEDVPGYAGMLAYHYGKGGAVERAEEFLFRAGAEAARAAAPSEALHFFEEASKLYLEIHRDGGDPEKRALLEQNIAEALYYRGRFLDAIEHFNVALRLLGDRVVEGRWQLGAAASRATSPPCSRDSTARSSGGARAPRPRARREIMELRYARAEATVTTQPTRHLFDSMDTLAFLQRIDPRSVPGAGKFYAGRRGALRVRRHLVRRRAPALRPGTRAGAAETALDEVIYERAMHFTYRVLEGDWSDAARDRARAASRRACGTASSGARRPISACSARSALRRGDFAGARACLAEIDRIWDLFQYDLAKTNFYYLHTLLPLEEGDYPRARRGGRHLLRREPRGPAPHPGARARRRRPRSSSASSTPPRQTLARAAEIVARSSPVPPFHGSAYHRSRLLLDVVAPATPRPRTAATAPPAAPGRQQARKSARVALRSAAKVAWRRTEVLRLAGRYHWLVGASLARAALLRAQHRAGERLGMHAGDRAHVGRGRPAPRGARRALPRPRRGRLPRAGARDRSRSSGFTSDLERLAQRRCSDSGLDRPAAPAAVATVALGRPLRARLPAAPRSRPLAWVALVPFLVVAPRRRLATPTRARLSLDARRPDGASGRGCRARFRPTSSSRSRSASRSSCS